MDVDTIAAVATAPGEGGIAVVRISGRNAATIAGDVFRPRFGGDVSGFAGYTVHYGKITERNRGAAFNGADIDDALLTMFRAPRSYTGEDVCEIACHGGSATTHIVLDLILKAGARLALPGEFTQRAFLNGRIDLAQAEAVADLVRARTESARRMARRQLEGDVSRAAALVRDELVGIVAAIEVTIDFSDEVGDLDYPSLIERLSRATHDMDRLLSSADTGRVMRDGLNVAIVGRPNVGKSTLLNTMLRTNRAIVSSVPGTTRDTIQESIAIRGIPVVLTDTAGIRETEDAVERIGVERAKETVLSSDIMLLVVDASAGITSDDLLTARLIREVCGLEENCDGAAKCIVVWNKRDLVDEGTMEILMGDSASRLRLDRTVAVSAASKAGVEQLEEAIVAPYLTRMGGCRTSGADPISSVVVSNVRHVNALEEARACLTHAQQSALSGMPGDFIAIDVRGALDALGQITGETVSEDIIHRIFKEFCVGK